MRGTRGSPASVLFEGRGLVSKFIHPNLQIDARRPLETGAKIFCVDHRSVTLSIAVKQRSHVKRPATQSCWTYVSNHLPYRLVFQGSLALNPSRTSPVAAAEANPTPRPQRHTATQLKPHLNEHPESQSTITLATKQSQPAGPSTSRIEQMAVSLVSEPQFTLSRSKRIRNQRPLHYCPQRDGTQYRFPQTQSRALSASASPVRRPREFYQKLRPHRLQSPRSLWRLTLAPLHL